LKIAYAYNRISHPHHHPQIIFLSSCFFSVLNYHLTFIIYLSDLGIQIA
jgi:hypothetical protein